MKKLLISLAIIAIALPGVALASGEKYEVHIDKIRTEEPPMFKPDYIFPDNSDKKPADFQEIQKKLQQMRLKHPEAKIRQIKLVRYSEYLQILIDEGHSALESAEVHPNRMFFMVDIEQPDLTVNTRGRTQKLKNVRIKQAYDAETGQLWNNEITGNPENAQTTAQ